ncbi:MAG: ATP-binding cassette domain-containing protein [Acidimicrobiales bacterium]
MSALAFHGAGLVHGSGRNATVALLPTDLAVAPGESVGIIGRSGSGKTSLAELALGLRRPSHGRITVDGQAWSEPGRSPSRLRRRSVQGVPQDALATLPPRWTVERTLRTAARRLLRSRDVDAAVADALASAHVEPGLLHRRPHQLSGGQAQRIAIARALVAAPSVLVADEPTSALDDATAEGVIDTMLDLARNAGVAVLVVTHDEAIAGRCARLLEVLDGQVTETVR